MTCEFELGGDSWYAVRMGAWECVCLCSVRGLNYHLKRCQYEDDITDFGTVLPPVLRPVQPRDTYMPSLKVLHVAAVGSHTMSKTPRERQFHTTPRP